MSFFVTRKTYVQEGIGLTSSCLDTILANENMEIGVLQYVQRALRDVRSVLTSCSKRQSPEVLHGNDYRVGKPSDFTSTDLQWQR